MNHRRYKCLVFLSSCLLLPVALASQPQTVPAPATSAPLPVALVAPTPSEKMCVGEVFYEPLPGLANYCQGLQDWYAGHYRSGLAMLKLAAGWGNKNAQYTLGLIFPGGRHVPSDIPLGLAWLKLSNERDNDEQIARVADSALKWATRCGAFKFSTMARTSQLPPGWRKGIGLVDVYALHELVPSSHVVARGALLL